MSSVNNFTKVSNTLVSAQQILNNLTNPNCRDLVAGGQNGVRMSQILVNGASTGLPVNVLRQALLTSQLINTNNIATTLYLGPDATSQAQAYIDLFNIRSTNEVRVLRFHTIGAAKDITLANNNSTKLFVKVSNDGTAVNTANLYLAANAIPAATASGVGAERIVLFSASNLNSGSQSVLFNVLSFSN
jgi:hypothetical protein